MPGGPRHTLGPQCRRLEFLLRSFERAAKMRLSLESSSSGSDTEMHESLGNGDRGTPPLPNGRAAGGPPRSRLARDGPPSDLDVRKERFAKLLLGEDMSGTGKGVSSALALSNAITNLAGVIVSAI